MKPSTIAISLGLQDIARGLDHVIAGVAGERVAWSLIVYTEGRASYVSTAPRDDAVREIKRLVECWEQGMPDVPAHDYQG